MASRDGRTSVLRDGTSRSILKERIEKEAPMSTGMVPFFLTDKLPIAVIPSSPLLCLAVLLAVGDMSLS